MIEFLDAIMKVVAVARDVSSLGGNSGLVAMVAVAETLLAAEKSALIGDLERLKEIGLKKLDAGAEKQQAEARKALAEATDVANRAITKRHARKLERLAEQEKLANIRKLEAEANKAEGAARKEHAEAEIAEAKAARVAWQQRADERLFKALAQLGLEGGALNVDVEALRKLIGAPPLPAQPTIAEQSMVEGLYAGLNMKKKDMESAIEFLKALDDTTFASVPKPKPPADNTKPA